MCVRIFVPLPWCFQETNSGYNTYIPHMAPLKPGYFIRHRQYTFYVYIYLGNSLLDIIVDSSVTSASQYHISVPHISTTLLHTVYSHIVRTYTLAVCCYSIQEVCCQYWPSSGSVEVGELTVELLLEEELQGFVLRTLSVHHSDVSLHFMC